MRFPRAVALVLAALMSAALMTGLSGSSAQAVTAAPGWQARMLEKVNAVRAMAGVPPVTLCGRLQRSATAYARQMAATNHFSHTGEDGSDLLARVTAHGYRASMLGENIGAGQQSVVEVMRAWRASPAHYATLTSRAFQHVGFGYAPGVNDDFSTYWVQHFGGGGSC